MFLPSTLIHRLRWKNLCAGICLTACLLALLSLSPVGAAASPVKKVLLLHSHTQEFPAHRIFEQGFKEQLAISGENNVQYSYEYLELTQFSANANYASQLAEFFRQKYEDEPPDLIVTHLGPAADFMITYGQRIFPGVPVVLALDVIEGFVPRDLPPNVGGVLGAFNVKETVRLMLTLQPDIERVYVVLGDSERERMTLAAVQEDVASLAGRIEFVYLNKLPLPQMLDRIRKVREKAVILYLFVFKDAAGNVFVPANEVKTVRQAANVPVYSTYANFLGRGIIGGYLMSVEVMGRKAAEKSLAVLRGTTQPASLTPVEVAEYQFDWRELKRWGIDENKLPPGSKVLYREYTVWDLYKGYIAGGIAVVLLEALLVIALLFNRRKRKKAEDSLQRKNADLETAYREMESFSYSVAHDLRSPLRSMEGFSTILLEDYGNALDEKAQGFLNRIKASAASMDELIHDLLELSRISRSSIVTQTVDLSALVREAAEQHKQNDPERHAEILVQPDLHALGDAVLLKLLVANLIGNAWKYTGREDPARIEFGEQEMQGRRVFFVRDNGVGFNMAYVDKLFSTFQRLHTDADFKGTGIGLAIASRIVHKHGGEIWAEGAVDQGATFYFTVGES